MHWCSMSAIALNNVIRLFLRKEETKSYFALFALHLECHGSLRTPNSSSSAPKAVPPLLQQMLHWWQANESTRRGAFSCTHPLTPSARLVRLKITFVKSSELIQEIWTRPTCFGDKRSIRLEMSKSLDWCTSYYNKGWNIFIGEMLIHYPNLMTNLSLHVPCRKEERFIQYSCIKLQGWSHASILLLSLMLSFLNREIRIFNNSAKEQQFAQPAQKRKEFIN